MAVRNRILGLGAVVIVLAITLLLWSQAVTSASQNQPLVNPNPAAQETQAETQAKSLDLDALADQAEDQSQAVYGGLDTTKTIIGKTEARNQAIQHARDVASDKLQGLADEARQIDDPDQLSPAQQQRLKQKAE